MQFLDLTLESLARSRPLFEYVNALQNSPKNNIISLRPSSNAENPAPVDVIVETAEIPAQVEAVAEIAETPAPDESALSTPPENKPVAGLRPLPEFNFNVNKYVIVKDGDGTERGGPASVSQYFILQKFVDRGRQGVTSSETFIRNYKQGLTMKKCPFSL